MLNKSGSRKSWRMQRALDMILGRMNGRISPWMFLNRKEDVPHLLCQTIILDIFGWSFLFVLSNLQITYQFATFLKWTWTLSTVISPESHRRRKIKHTNRLQKVVSRLWKQKLSQREWTTPTENIWKPPRVSDKTFILDPFSHGPLGCHSTGLYATQPSSKA